MNERIRELWERAVFDKSNKDPDAMVQNFAELIVQECVNVLHDNELHNRHISHVLREHFGVEE